MKMLKKDKKIISWYLFLCSYIHFQYAGFIFGLKDRLNIDIDSIIAISLFAIIVYTTIKTKDIIIIFKLLTFMLLLMLFFYIESAMVTLTMYSIGDSGGKIRNDIIQNISYQFDWYEVLFWNCIFSLHYPLYLFYIIKPFINHIDNRLDATKGRSLA